MNVHIVHKYTDPAQCDLHVDLGGTESQRLLVLNIRRAGPHADEQNNVSVLPMDWLQGLSLPSAHVNMALLQGGRGALCCFLTSCEPFLSAAQILAPCPAV